MNFAATAEQDALLDTLNKLLGQAPAGRAGGERCVFSETLDAALEASGLLDAAGTEGFGPVAAALLIDQVARQPAIVEIGASALIRPLLCPDWPRPLAIIAGPPGRPARFLGQSRSVLFLGPDVSRIATIGPGDSAAVGGFFAYPLARLTDPGAHFARSEVIGDGVEVRRLWQIAIACEIAGALQGALETVTEHLKSRRQFGRPLGSFQAVQHRLAAGVAKIVAARLLARRAADLGDTADALTALGYAQDCAAGILYDLHQFMGAMGLTLEHPLYLWSYRVKLLLSELGGSSGQLAGLASALWSKETKR
jgi:Acyl-CoA dehydrogenase, C-terminal domain